MKVAVVGAGIVGLASAYELSGRGARVVLYEAAVPMSRRSRGDSRIFRIAHAEPALVGIAVESLRLWRAWSAIAGHELLGKQGVLISGDSATEWAEAMRAAEQPVTERSDLPSGLELPTRRATGPFALDAAGGVIDVTASARFLLHAVGHSLRRDTVLSVLTEPRPTILTTRGSERYDAILVCAGAHTTGLAATHGLELPDELVRHVRFTFPLMRPLSATPCWIESSYDWRPWFSSYSHVTPGGGWAIGGSLPPEDTSFGLDPSDVLQRSLDVITAYVRDRLPDIDPRPIEHIECDYPVIPGDDGFDAHSVGGVFFLWGHNLFKFAPWLGLQLAKSVLDGGVSGQLHQIHAGSR